MTPKTPNEEGMLGTMRRATLYLHPSAGFAGEVPFRSDTLFGAICWGYRVLFGREALVSEILEPFEGGAPPFLLTSAFPFQEGEGGRRRHLLPPPLLPGRRVPRWGRDFVTERYFSRLIAGEGGSKEECSPSPFETRLFLRPGARWGRGRRGSVTEVEHFQRGGGLYCCLACAGDTLFERLTSVLAYFGDVGLGGGASRGRGAYTLSSKPGPPPWEEPVEGDHFVTLSLLFPDGGLLAGLTRSCYRWEVRAGRISTRFSPVADTRKDPVLMCVEGSIFPITGGRRIYGGNPIVRTFEDAEGKGVRVQHYGYAFPVRCRFPENSAGGDDATL